MGTVHNIKHTKDMFSLRNDPRKDEHKGCATSSNDNCEATGTGSKKNGYLANLKDLNEAI